MRTGIALARQLRPKLLSLISQLEPHNAHFYPSDNMTALQFLDGKVTADIADFNSTLGFTPLLTIGSIRDGIEVQLLEDTSLIVTVAGLMTLIPIVGSKRRWSTEYSFRVNEQTSEITFYKSSQTCSDYPTVITPDQVSETIIRIACRQPFTSVE